MRRWTTRIVLLIIGGFILNVLVTVWMAVYEIDMGPSFYMTRTFQHDELWSRYRGSDWPFAAPPIGIDWQSNPPTQAGFSRKDSRNRIDQWVMALDLADPLPTAHRFIRHTQLGWPALSVEGTQTEVTSQGSIFQSRAFDGWLICVGTKPSPLGTAATVPDERLIPYNPIWRGLIINTAFYAFLLALLYAFVLGLQYLWRSFRAWRYEGRCPKCGFNLMESGTVPARYMLERGCPECGWLREDAARPR